MRGRESQRCRKPIGQARSDAAPVANDLVRRYRPCICYRRTRRFTRAGRLRFERPSTSVVAAASILLFKSVVVVRAQALCVRVFDKQ